MSLFAQMTVLRALMALDGMEPTALDPGEDVAVFGSETGFVEARWAETVIRGRPWVPYRRIATVARGTRLVVRGQVESRDDAGCNGDIWYAVHPFGFVCSRHVRPSEDPPQWGPTLAVGDGRRLPYAYAIVREEGVPMYRSQKDVVEGVVDRTLVRKMSLAIRRSVEIEGQRFLQTVAGTLVPKQGVGWMGQGSQWHGVWLERSDPGPLFAWVRSDKTAVRSTPAKTGDRVRSLARRERVPLHERDPSKTWWRIGDDEWVAASALNEVHITEVPEGVVSDYRVRKSGNDQWIDVDVGEQVLVAYSGSQPVYATLVSSGARTRTPLGNYPIWAKVASMDMANQDYEDKPYMVQGVPWVLLFQGHNALHGAYWHDRFGTRKSHGCVNLSPLDARWLFEWVGPSMPSGWTGYLPSDLDRSAVVHVRDSSKSPGQRFVQDRRVGPPDREAERRKSQDAERRRALADAAAFPDDAPAAFPDADPADGPAMDAPEPLEGQL